MRAAVGVVALAYGALCLLAFCAVLLLIAFGKCSALGLSLALVALAAVWSGVPLLPLAACKLRGGDGLAVEVVAALVGPVPSAAYLAPTLPEPIVFTPVAISLVLYLLTVLDRH